MYSTTVVTAENKYSLGVRPLLAACAFPSQAGLSQAQARQEWVNWFKV